MSEVNLHLLLQIHIVHVPIHLKIIFFQNDNNKQKE